MISDAALEILSLNEDNLKRGDFTAVYDWIGEHLNEYPITVTGELTTEFLRLCKAQLEDNLYELPQYFLYDTKRPFYRIPKKITWINPKALSGCNFTSLVIPSNVVGIGALACSYLPFLEEVLIEEGVTTIDSEAFLSNYRLQEVTIPKSVTLMNKNIFNECPNVTLLVHKGSLGERYAKLNNLRYRYLV